MKRNYEEEGRIKENGKNYEVGWWVPPSPPPPPPPPPPPASSASSQGDPKGEKKHKAKQTQNLNIY